MPRQVRHLPADIPDRQRGLVAVGLLASGRREGGARPASFGTPGEVWNHWLKMICYNILFKGSILMNGFLAEQQFIVPGGGQHAQR